MKDNEGQEILNYITEEDVQLRAEELLGRRLTKKEIDVAGDSILGKIDELIMEALDEMTEDEHPQALTEPSDF